MCLLSAILKPQESENYSKSQQFYNQNVPYDPIKKKEYPHFVFLSTNKKVIGVWKSEVVSCGSQRREQRTSIYTREKSYVLYFHM